MSDPSQGQALNASPNLPQNPYESNVYNNGYDQSNPYANPTNPYANPYGNQTNPYGNQGNPYGNQGNPYGNQTNPYNGVNNQYYGQAPNENAYPGPVATPVQPQPGMTPNNGAINSQPQYGSNLYYETPDKYDPYNINYQQVTVDQWNQIPCQQTEYSQYWDSTDSFQPENYQENTTKETQCNDLAWTIIFWINFVATIVLLIYLLVTKNTKNPEISIKLEGIKSKDIGIIAAVGLGLGIVSNIIHFIFIACCSTFYLGCGMAIGLIYSIISALILMLAGGGMVGFILPAIYLVLLIIYYCCACKYIKFSSAILKTSAVLLMEYPGIICFCLLQILWSLIVNAIYCILIYFIQKRGLHPAVYLYVVLSYLWSTLTFEYVEYLTVSGVASTWYFLKDTEYYPSSPLCQSYKRAMGTSFGSAAFAGFILAIIQFLEMIIEYSSSDSSEGGALATICCLLKCIAMCILCLLESIVSLLNRYALVYCAAFGIPYIAACKRFIELECTRFVRVIMSQSVISTATTYNLLFYSIASALGGYGLSHLIFKNKNEYMEGTKLLFKVLCCCFALLFTFGIFEAVVEPILTISDTLFICFSEYPEALKRTDIALYETIVETYDTGLSRQISGKSNNEDSP